MLGSSENVGMNYHGSLERRRERFMNFSGHRDNTLREASTRAGVDVHVDEGTGQMCVTHNSIIVR